MEQPNVGALRGMWGSVAGVQHVCTRSVCLCLRDRERSWGRTLGQEHGKYCECKEMFIHIQGCSAAPCPVLRLCRSDQQPLVERPEAGATIAQLALGEH